MLLYMFLSIMKVKNEYSFPYPVTPLLLDKEKNSLYAPAFISSNVACKGLHVYVVLHLLTSESTCL